MNKNETIANDEELSEVSYQKIEAALFSDSSSVKELEKICMTLAHQSSKKAQDLLGKFKKSKRSAEVEWIDCAIEEGQWWYLDPQNEFEEREYLALKIMQEIEDELVEIEIELDDFRLEKRWQEIEHKALRELAGKNKISNDEILGLDDLETINNSRIIDLEEKIELKQKIFDQIKGSIKTERYKTMDLSEMRSIHFTR